MARDHGFDNALLHRLSRRRLLAAGGLTLGALAGASLLAACGGDDDEEDDGGASATTAPSDATAAGGTTPEATGAATEPAADDEPTATGAASGSGDEPKQGGTLVVAETNDADNLDPHRYYTTFASRVIAEVTETVIQLNQDLELEPILLESIEVSEDGLLYTMHVREGITFHDGSTLDAEAIKFSHERANNDLAAYPGQFYGATWEVIDPLTVNMIMPEANSGVMLILAFTGCGIVPPAAVAEMNDDMSQNPIGSGPFMFKEWVTGDHATLVAYDGYQNFHSQAQNKGRPHIDEMTIRVMPEEQTQIAAFESGEVQLLLVPSQQVERFEGNDDYQLFRNEQTTTCAYLAPVILEQADGSFEWNPPFDDPAVRQALGWALNVDEIITGVLDGLAVRNRSSLPAGNPGYSERFQEMGFDYDPDKARQLLEDAGWTEGSGGVREKDGQKLSIVFWVEAGATRERIGQLVQNYLQEVGFEVDFQAIEAATFVDQRQSGDVHLVYTTYNWNDPDIVWWLGNDTSLVQGNYGQINPEYADTGAQGWSVTDLDERAAFYYDAAKMMVDDGAIIPLWNPVTVDGVRSEVKGYALAAQGRRFLTDTWLDQG